jgi:hypothetical protein
MTNCSVTAPCRSRHAADVVAAEVEQHQVLGALLGVGQQLGGQRLVLLDGGAALARAGDRPHGDVAVLEPHQDLRRGADDVEVLEVEVEHVGRGVQRAQRAVERQRRSRQGLRSCAARAPPA